MSEAQYGIHGSSAGDNAPIIAGMTQRLQQGAAFVFNNLAFQQVSVETAGMSAERSTGGVQMTMIPKDGGNIFSGSFEHSRSAELAGKQCHRRSAARAG